jgi:hypothetical protein
MLVTGVAAYLSVRYLVRYFRTRTLRPGLTRLTTG